MTGLIGQPLLDWRIKTNRRPLLVTLSRAKAKDERQKVNRQPSKLSAMRCWNGRILTAIAIDWIRTANPVDFCVT